MRPRASTATPSCGLNWSIARRHAKADAPELRLFVLQREVVMPASRQLARRDFTRDPDVAKLAVKQAAQQVGEFGDREEASFRFPKELNLFHRSECMITMDPS